MQLPGKFRVCVVRWERAPRRDMARTSFPHHHHQQQPPIKKMSPSLSGLPDFAGLPRCGYRRGKYKKKNIAAQYSSRVSAMLMLSVILIF